MEAIIYVVIFIIGITFGSFYTLATYRIPKKQDITHTRSYCPNCNHKLGFFDMFPVLSYILLGGKCKYCKKKISPRYIILEIFSGLIFLAVFYLMKIDLSDIRKINILELIKYLFMSLYITFIFITVGIDKENRKIEKSVSIFGIIISLIYIAYLCIVEKANIYRYVIYTIFYILVLILDTIALKKYAKNIYIYGITTMLITMAIFTGEIVTFCTIILALILSAFKIIYEKLKDKKSRIMKETQNKISNIEFAYLLGISNFISYIIINIVLQWR